MGYPTTSTRNRMESVLQEAERLINGDRRASYGHPLDEYERLAAFISIALADNLNEPITAEQAMLLMVLLKLNRHISDPQHRDSLVDAAGYIGCIELAIDEREARKAACDTL
jgi:hypothetical protein